MDAVAGTIGEIVTFGLDDRYFDSYADQVRAQTLATVDRGSPRDASIPTSSSGSSWATAPGSSRASGRSSLGEIRLIDADGKPLGPT